MQYLPDRKRIMEANKSLFCLSSSISDISDHSRSSNRSPSPLQLRRMRDGKAVDSIKVLVNQIAAGAAEKKAREDAEKLAQEIAASSPEKVESDTEPRRRSPRNGQKSPALEASNPFKPRRELRRTFQAKERSTSTPPLSTLREKTSLRKSVLKRSLSARNYATSTPISAEPKTATVADVTPKRGSPKPKTPVEKRTRTPSKIPVRLNTFSLVVKDFNKPVDDVKLQNEAIEIANTEVRQLESESSKKENNAALVVPVKNDIGSSDGDASSTDSIRPFRPDRRSLFSSTTVELSPVEQIAVKDPKSKKAKIKILNNITIKKPKGQRRSKVKTSKAKKKDLLESHEYDKPLESIIYQDRSSSEPEPVKSPVKIIDKKDSMLQLFQSNSNNSSSSVDIKSNNANPTSPRKDIIVNNSVKVNTTFEQPDKRVTRSVNQNSSKIKNDSELLKNIDCTVVLDKLTLTNQKLSPRKRKLSYDKSIDNATYVKGSNATYDIPNSAKVDDPLVNATYNKTDVNKKTNDTHNKETESIVEISSTVNIEKSIDKTHESVKNKSSTRAKKNRQVSSGNYSLRSRTLHISPDIVKAPVVEELLADWETFTEKPDEVNNMKKKNRFNEESIVKKRKGRVYSVKPRKIDISIQEESAHLTTPLTRFSEIGLLQAKTLNFDNEPTSSNSYNNLFSLDDSSKKEMRSLIQDIIDEIDVEDNMLDNNEHIIEPPIGFMDDQVSETENKINDENEDNSVKIDVENISNAALTSKSIGKDSSIVNRPFSSSKRLTTDELLKGTLVIDNSVLRETTNISNNADIMLPALNTSKLNNTSNESLNNDNAFKKPKSVPRRRGRPKRISESEKTSNTSVFSESVGRSNSNGMVHDIEHFLELSKIDVQNISNVASTSKTGERSSTIESKPSGGRKKSAKGTLAIENSVLHDTTNIRNNVDIPSAQNSNKLEIVPNNSDNNKQHEFQKPKAAPKKKGRRKLELPEPEIATTSDETLSRTRSGRVVKQPHRPASFFVMSITTSKKLSKTKGSSTFEQQISQLTITKASRKRKNTTLSHAVNERTGLEVVDEHPGNAPVPEMPAMEVVDEHPGNAPAPEMPAMENNNVENILEVTPRSSSPTSRQTKQIVHRPNGTQMLQLFAAASDLVFKEVAPGVQAVQPIDNQGFMKLGPHSETPMYVCEKCDLAFFTLNETGQGRVQIGSTFKEFTGISTFIVPMMYPHKIQNTGDSILLFGFSMRK